MKRWIVLPLLALLVAILHAQIFFSSWGERIEPLVLDIWFNIRGPIAPPDDVVIVAMDEQSYRILNVPMDSAWPRALHVELIKRLADYHPKRIAMDILFLDESSDKEVDKALANAFKLTPTVLAAESEIRDTGRTTTEELQVPPDMFTDSAERVALARLPDDFSYIRRFSVPRTSATRTIPSLYEAAIGLDKVGEPPSYPGPRDYIWYYGPRGAIPTYPIHQVFNPKGQLPLSTFKDKTIFIGLTLRSELGPAQKDLYRTPFLETYGIEIQATAADNVLSHQWIRRASGWTEGIFLFLATLILTAAIFWLRPQWAGLLLIVFSLAWAISSYLLFLNGFFLPGVILVCVILPFSYLGSTLIYYFVTHKSQQQVEKAFQMYLSPEMARQMRSNSGGLSLGGESLYATALFSDIEGFTTITEDMSAQEVSNMLNAYFTEVMDVIFNNKGTLIKFIGDAVFALWGAPIKEPEHARFACETALKIQKEVDKFNASKRFPALNTKVGINTGTMVVGNLGSSRRFDYTAIGDSVNLASRLEGLNRYFGTNILISESTRKEMGGRIKTIPLGLILAAGKREAIEVHTIFDSPVDSDVEANWNKALARFRGKNWEEAEKLFLKVRENESRLKKCVEIYLIEIGRYMERPPKDEWYGEIEFTKK